MSGTGTIAVDEKAIPDALVERDQWVCWREEEREDKPTKVPIQPGVGRFASTTDPETWTGFEKALEYSKKDDVVGIGFVFSEDDPIVGVDLDDCRDPSTGDIDSPARDIVERLDSYTEVSPSGTGLHVIVQGTLPDGRNRRGSVELYESARFFTVTGDHVAGTSTRVARRQGAIEEVHRDYVQDDEFGEGDRSTVTDQSRQHEPAPNEVDLEDGEIIRRARNAANGEKFEQLWNGSTSGYDSHSEADMALCCLLAFWTGGNRSQIDRLFRQSGLMREKWDEVHYADGSTYGEKTVERAVGAITDHYDPEISDVALTPKYAGPSPDPHSNPTGPPQDTAHLVEKNRLLTNRIAELESEIEAKEDRIAELEEMLQRHQD